MKGNVANVNYLLNLDDERDASLGIVLAWAGESFAIILKKKCQSVICFVARSTMRHILSFTLVTIVLDCVHSQESKEHQGPQTCGGHLKGHVGTIQTPNFPNPFPVPIKCRWVIEHDIVNGTISIYFTQQYTTSGLTFTEYMYYDESYKLGERRALTVTEENITRIKWLQVR